jgi:hypothetical protein
MNLLGNAAVIAMALVASPVPVVLKSSVVALIGVWVSTLK